MNTNRMRQIIESLNGLGTKQNAMYTKASGQKSNVGSLIQGGIRKMIGG